MHTTCFKFRKFQSPSWCIFT